MVSLVLRQYMRGENGTESSALRISSGQLKNNQLFEGSLVSVKSIEKVTSTQEQVQEYCNWRKEALFRL